MQQKRIAIFVALEEERQVLERSALIQERVDSDVPFSRRRDAVLLDKPDRWGLAVWDRDPKGA
ncbi:hypothetical protein IVA96_04420 [Bradyrhizobium sp. 159]|uniref:hypothetical protein n=1 Tax=Bradyrhizobium sp. 159 TaxID=2782632 RepID=UPI001FF827C4|nr:hypothetical protein [Bradyrhizobium sp. 159]MCK1615945.1 hypothetical protein [Bradyrhizobium sp. 159]